MRKLKVMNVKPTKALSRKKPGKIKPNRGVWTANPTPLAKSLKAKAGVNNFSIAMARKIVDFLNSVLEIDRTAVSYLLMNRVQCNRNLRDHETVQCGTQHNAPFVSALGMLNGICGVNKHGVGHIAAEMLPVRDRDPVSGFNVDKFKLVDPNNKEDLNSLKDRKVRDTWAVTCSIPKGSKSLQNILIEKSNDVHPQKRKPKKRTPKK